MNEMIKCKDLEILLADYLDGSLASEEKTAVELHLAQCAACGELARDASSAMVFLANAPEMEAPPLVIRQILRATTERPKPGFLAQVFGNGFAFPFPRFSFASLLQPRVAMGLAMAALSLVMVGRFWGTAEHAAYRAWDRTLSRTLSRTVNGYENLAVVYDVQNQLDEWRAQLNGGSQNNPAGSDGRK